MKSRPDSTPQWMNLIREVILKEKLIAATFSGPAEKKHQPYKITLRPLKLKQGGFYQITEHFSDKALHKNLSPPACIDLIQEQLLVQYKQAVLLCVDKNYQILKGAKGNYKLLERPPTKALPAMAHNRSKQYLLQEGNPIPFLVALGIMNSEGKVHAQKRDKFKQINRFLEIVSDILPATEGQCLRVLDFGCGKAYLTFSLYHYLSHLRGIPIEMRGIDLKTEVIARCQALADELGYTGLRFVREDIHSYNPKGKIDLMVSLHACDTATDAALEKAIAWKADAILCVPCCQHEVFKQIANPTLGPILEHGILKEKFSALVTDAARGKLLEYAGYSVQIMEFIDPEHTPKNILIRAVRTASDQRNLQSLAAYKNFAHMLGIFPALEKKLLG